MQFTSDLGGWPLWADEDESQDDLVGATDPEDWPALSNNLKQQLCAWNVVVLRSCHLKGAKSQKAWADAVVTGKRLVQEVQNQLGPTYDVVWAP